MTTLTASIAAITTATVTIALEIDALIHLRADLASLAASHAECASVREAQHLLLAGFRPMWPALPASEQPTRRGTDKEYLYFYWARDPMSSAYSGPDGARKTYLGCKPTNIALAREMVASRRRFLALRTGIDQIAAAIRAVQRETTSAAAYAARSRVSAEELALEADDA